MPVMALEGIRVVELATGIAGPFCGKLLADYGAEVIKVEAPAGDPTRRQGPFPDDSPHREKSALFLHLNTNKAGVTLDLEDARERELLRRLVQRSQVLIESYKPGRMKAMGLGYDALKELRPELVMTSVTPYGQAGPHKDYEFTELTIFAATGAMRREGMPDRHPLKYGGEIAQYYAGTAAAAVTSAAVLASALGGQGQWIDVSIQECMAGHPHQIGRRAPFAYSGETDPRRDPHTAGSSNRESYAVGTFRCKDGHVSFLPLGPRMWPNLARMVGREEMLEDPRFATPKDRSDRYTELGAIFQAWLDCHTREEVFAAAQEAGLPAGPVLTTGEVISNGHFDARGYFEDIDHPDAGALTYTGLPFRLSDAPRQDSRPAPRLGQHNDDVFGAIIGVGDDDLKALRRHGVI